MQSLAEEYVSVRSRKVVKKKPRIRNRRPAKNLSSARGLRQGPFLGLDWCDCEECLAYATEQRAINP